MDRAYRRPPTQTQRQRQQTVDGFSRPVQPSVKRLPTKGEAHKRTAKVATTPRAGLPSHSLRWQAAHQMPLQHRKFTRPTLRGFDMALPGATEENRKQPVIRTARLRTFRIWAFRAAIACLVMIVGVSSIVLATGYWKLHKVFNGKSSTAVALQKDANPELLKGEGDGRINILLLGIGGGDHEAPDLTDTIMLASVDPVNNKADLVSVPRDLWVNVAGYGNMKLNAAYETGKYAYLHKIDNSNANDDAVAAGFAMADRTIGQVLGVKVNYNVLVDFQAFRQAVDTVGGVTVNVPEQLYDPTMAWENDWNPVLAKPGVQIFDGKHALIYVRSRETSSDFARAERQRAVLMALKDKVLSLGTLSDPLKINQLLGAFGDNVQTDLSLNDTTRLVSLMKKVSNGNIQSVGFADAPNKYVTTDHVGNQSVVRPSAGFFDYTAIQKYVRSILVDGYIAKENARILVLNGTSTPNLAEQKANDLKSYGYNVVGVDGAPTATYQNSVLVDLTHGKDIYTAHYLQQRFGVAPVSTVPDAAIQTGQADFIIVLGNDETFSSPD